MTVQKTSAARSRRDGPGTRQAILESAIVLFTLHGYDGVGVREIANGADVTAMLVNRYFGSKEKLFEEVVEVTFAPRAAVPLSSEQLSRKLARSLASRSAPKGDLLDPFLLLIRSASNPRATEIVREAIGRNVSADLTAVIPGRSAELRAELVLALTAGTWLMRTLIGSPALTAASDRAVARLLADMFAAVTGTE